MLEARLSCLVRSLAGVIRKQSTLDAAEHVRTSIREAKKEGPASLAKKLRHVMKSGRRYRAPNAPALRVDDGFVSDPAEVRVMLERRFAKPERASEHRLVELLVDDVPGVHETLDMTWIPSVMDIAEGYLACGSCPRASFLEIAAERTLAAIVAGHTGCGHP